jgi:hypothetical protein
VGAATVRVAAACVLGSALLALAACGGDGSTVTVTETAAGGPSPGAPATTETSSTTDPTAEDGSPPESFRFVKKLTGFTSPTGNIGCYIDRANVRCDIGDRNWEPPKAPKSCTLDYGQGIELRTGAAADFVCAGDTTLGAGDALDYGRSIGAGLLICESEESGMTCRDTETGRGFTISKESYEIF